MTEIPVYPGGAPDDVPGMQGEPPGGYLAGIHAILHRAANRLPDPRNVRNEKNRAIWPVRVDPIPMALTGGAGVLDLPNSFSPSMGYNWDVHSISATGFTVGTVSGWINVPSIASGAPAGALRAPFPSAGVLTWGKGQLWLRQGERLAFIGLGITGIVLISLDATQIADEWVGEYFA